MRLGTGGLYDVMMDYLIGIAEFVGISTRYII